MNTNANTNTNANANTNTNETECVERASYARAALLDCAERRTQCLDTAGGPHSLYSHHADMAHR